MSFSRAFLVGFGTTKVYSGVGADIVVESITRNAVVSVIAWSIKGFVKNIFLPPPEARV
jgi:hypothetical protein